MNANFRIRLYIIVTVIILSSWNWYAYIMDDTTVNIREDSGVEQKRYFIILSTARSGSTLLVDLLNNHPHVKCHLEPLNDEELVANNLQGADKNRLLQHIKDSVKSEDKLSVGFKIFVEQLDATGVSFKDIVDSFDQPNVIVLYRENVLETFVSLQIAYANDIWYSMDKANKAKINLNWTEFQEYSQALKRMWEVALKDIGAYPNTLTVTYDKLCNDRKSEMVEVISFLGLRKLYREFESYSIKQNPGSLKDKISNYDEIMAYIVEDSGGLVNMQI